MMNEKYTTDKILIFDLDDTIVVSAAKIIVTDSKNKKTFELTPEEFNDYERNPKHLVNFDQFSERFYFIGQMDTHCSQNKSF